MLTSDLGVLAAAGLCGAFGAAVTLLVVGLRGVAPSPGRPPGPLARAVAALGRSALSGRLAGGVLVAVAVTALTGWPVAAGGLGGLVAGWPVLFGGGRAEAGQIERLEALVVWTESLRDTVGGHASLEQAIPVTAANAPPLIRPALARLVGQLRARVPLDKALLNLAAWLDDASADLVLAALILNAARRGGGLGHVLGGLSVAAREELDMRRKVSAGRSGLRRGVQIVVGVTIAFGVFLATVGGTYVRPYDTLAGQVALSCVLGIFAVGFAWMRRLSGTVPVAAFLARPGQAPDPDDLAVVAGLTGLSAAAIAELAAPAPDRAPVTGEAGPRTAASWNAAPRGAGR